MDPVFRIMCDVADLVARGSDAARMEARRVAAERERRAAARVADFADRAVTSADEVAEPASAPRRWLKAAFLFR